MFHMGILIYSMSPKGNFYIIMFHKGILIYSHGVAWHPRG